MSCRAAIYCRVNTPWRSMSCTFFSMVKVNDAYPTENYTKSFSDYGQCWKILFGLKYFFN